MTLHLPPVLLRQMLEHCHAEHPLEACGLLPGRDDRPVWHLPMRNDHDNPTRYFAFEVDEELTAYRAMDDADEHPIVVYHSHTASAPEPSGTDRAYFKNPKIHYVIVSTHDAPGEWPRVRSWRYREGSLVEEPIIATARCG